MSELEVLEVKVRETFGKRRIRRLRAGGFVPANLYGHKQETVSLMVDEVAIGNILRHGHQIVKLAGASNDEALIKEVQWNVWGNEILHVDFTRIDANEKIKVVVPFVMKGEAAGVREGGVLEMLIHEVEVECSATNVPENIVVNVSDLTIGSQLTVANIAFPEGVVADLVADAVVVSCVVKNEEVAAAEEAGVGEPEVIARKKDAEEE